MTVPAKPTKPTKITYKFIFPDGESKSYDALLDGVSGRWTSPPLPSAPQWTELEHHKCSHCPLKSSEHPSCPVALNIAAVADDFKTLKSTERATVEVITAERTYRKDLYLQEGLFGLFGLIMATSDCPYLEFLRPMARFHLPFSSLRETMVRSVSFYLLRQYFVAKNGGKPDYELIEFAKRYADLDAVNLGLANRLRSIIKADVGANSIIILDGLAKLLSMQLASGLKDLENIFAS